MTPSPSDAHGRALLAAATSARDALMTEDPALFRRAALDALELAVPGALTRSCSCATPATVDLDAALLVIGAATAQMKEGPYQYNAEWLDHVAATNPPEPARPSSGAFGGSGALGLEPPKANSKIYREAA